MDCSLSYIYRLISHTIMIWNQHFCIWRALNETYKKPQHIMEHVKSVNVVSKIYLVIELLWIIKQRQLRNMPRRRKQKKDEQIHYLTNWAWIEFWNLAFNINRPLSFTLLLFKPLMTIVVLTFEMFGVNYYSVCESFNINIVKKYCKNWKIFYQFNQILVVFCQ